MKALTICLLFLSTVTGATNGNGARGFILCSMPEKYDHVSMFINKHWNAAQAIQNEVGVPIAISLAVWSLESKYGAKPIKLNNFGSIKKKGSYVCYDHVSHFYTDFAKIFKHECYLSLQPYTLHEWCESLQYECCTYAVSRKYYKKLMWIIKEFNLYAIPLPQVQFEQFR